MHANRNNVLAFLRHASLKFVIFSTAKCEVFHRTTSLYLGFSEKKKTSNNDTDYVRAICTFRGNQFENIKWFLRVKTI